MRCARLAAGRFCFAPNILIYSGRERAANCRRARLHDAIPVARRRRSSGRVALRPLPSSHLPERARARSLALRYAAFTMACGHEGCVISI